MWEWLWCCRCSSASLDEGSSGSPVLVGQVKKKKNNLQFICNILSVRSLTVASTLSRLHRPQPSSSCSFDGSLKTDQTEWPEVPPVLNQNEDRKRNKYLRKDYLKVWQDPDWGSHFCGLPLMEQRKTIAWMRRSCFGRVHDTRGAGKGSTLFLLHRRFSAAPSGHFEGVAASQSSIQFPACCIIYIFLEEI